MATWLQPIGDAEVVTASDPAERAVQQESVRLAFVAALQHLPPRQRAVLLLREVLAWSAADTAELLETSVPSVNSALQRARATLATLDAGSRTVTTDQLGGEDKALLTRYVAAFETYDIESLVQLLHEDAGFSMPPLALWLQGREDIGGWYLGHGIGCRGSRMFPVSVNGQPGFAQYKPAAGGGHEPGSIQVVEISGGRIRHLHHFLGPDLFTRLGFPLHLP